MSSAKLKVFVSETFNPWFNIATEDWIFRDMDTSHEILFLWRNQETVVIGRSQNPWIECNLKKMESDGVLLARRRSGGGAVFHDLGNTNFTFLSSRESYSRERNVQIILNALAKFGIKGQASGRNDLVIPLPDGPKKFSGSAFRETRDRCFHHGTLLINANLERLNEYLTPRPKKLVSKGNASVRSRVVNLTELAPEVTHENLCHEIVKSFFECYGAECPIEKLNHDELTSNPSLMNRFNELSEWKWRFGETMLFTHQFNERLFWGEVDVQLEVKNAVIQRAKIYSDSLFPDLIESIEAGLLGSSYQAASLQKICSGLKKKFPLQEKELSDFESWFIGQIE